MQECNLVLSPITVQPDSQVSEQFRCRSHNFGFPVTSSVLVDIEMRLTCSKIDEFVVLLEKSNLKNA